MNIVKLSDVVVRANTKEDRKTTTRIYYAAGEQVEPQELLVRKKGIIAEADLGPMFYFGFKTGQVLLPSRSFESKKAAVATYDGICSEKTFVLETKDPSVLLQEYLVFIIQNESFWQYAEENKSGSVNYFLNWSAIANYEFTLPSLSEQKVLADKLWAAYRVKESYKKLLAATDDMLKAKFQEMFGDPVKNEKKWYVKSLSEVAPESASNHKLTGTVWNLNLDMIESGTGLLIEKVYIPHESLNSVVPFDEENVLYSKLRPYLNKVIIPAAKGYATTELVPLRPDTTLLNMKFLSYILRSEQFVAFANGIATGTKMPRIPMAELRKFNCILPPLPLQQQFVEIATQAEATKESLRKSIENIDQVIKSLINQ